MNLLQFLVLLPATVLTLIVAIKTYLKYSVSYCTSTRRLDGRVALVTGATSGIGLETARGLAVRGARIIIGARNVAAAEVIAQQLRTETKNKNIVVKHVDLSLMSSVRRFCAELKKEETRLDLLVNNAGVALTEKRRTAEGMEAHYATNHLGPFLLTNLLLELMSRSSSGSTPAAARIVNVSSTAHKWPRSLDLVNRNSAIRYESSMIYQLTKLYNILFTVHLHRLLGAAGLNVTVNAVHPGVVCTELFRHARQLWLWRIMLGIAYSFFRTPWEGAQCTLHAAVSEEVDGVSGKYWDNCKVAKMSELATRETAEEFWRMSRRDAELQPEEDWLGKLLAKNEI